jgi:hypothetical protein
VTWGEHRSTLGVASPELLAALDAPPAAARALAAGDVVARFEGPEESPVEIGVPRGLDAAGHAGVPVVVDDGPGGSLLPRLLVSEGWARARGLATIDKGVLFRAPDDLTEAQLAAVAHRTVDRSSRDAWIRSQVLGEPPPIIRGWVVTPDTEPDRPTALTQLLTGAILGFTLIVVAVALALNAAENRDERDLLAALGAPPRVQRSVTAWQALLLPLAGAAVGVPLGVGGAAAVRVARSAADDVPAHLTVAWGGVALLLVAVPVASALAAGLVATVTSRRGPAPAASLAAD